MLVYELKDILDTIPPITNICTIDDEGNTHNIENCFYDSEEDILWINLD